MSDEAKNNLGKNPKLSPLMKTIEQGASTSVWAAVAPELEGVGGKYLEDCQITEEKTHEKLLDDYNGHTSYSVDEASAVRLWNISKEWLKNPPK